MFRLVNKVLKDANGLSRRVLGRPRFDFMCMWVLMAKRCHKVEGRVFWEFGENVGECGSNVG